MLYIKQFSIIVGISFVGELLNNLIPLPVPASIYGLVIMFLLLLSGILKLHHVKETANFLLAIMALLFVPAAVGIMDTWSILSKIIIPVGIITVVSTVVILFITGKTTDFFIKLLRKEENNESI